MDTSPREIACALVDRLIDLPGDFTITLQKRGDTVEIRSGTPKDYFKSLREVADHFGISTATARRRFINTNLLRRTPDGFRRGDVERLKNRNHGTTK
jgi:hypothetical protein